MNLDNIEKMISDAIGKSATEKKETVEIPIAIAVDLSFIIPRLKAVVDIIKKEP